MSIEDEEYEYEVVLDLPSFVLVMLISMGIGGLFILDLIWSGFLSAVGTSLSLNQIFKLPYGNEYLVNLTVILGLVVVFGVIVFAVYWDYRKRHRRVVVRG